VSAPSRLSPILQRWDWLVFLFLVLTTLPGNLLFRRALFVVQAPNPLDDSWVLDSTFKASRGIWLGKDVAFTYGPLFQWLSSLPARWMGVSMGSIYTTWNLLPMWCTFLAAFLTLRLLLPEQPAWKRSLLLILLVVFWSPADLRISFAILCFSLFFRGWGAVRDGRLHFRLFGTGAAVLCTVGFLYSADTGVYAVAAFAISLLGMAWDIRKNAPESRKGASPGSLAGTLAVFAAASLVLTIAINTLMAGAFDFRFWKNSLVIVSAYRWMEPEMMTKASKVRLFLILGTGSLLFLLRALSGRKLSTVASSGFLFSAFLFALVTLQSGLVRSDEGHIALAAFALIFFSGTLLFSFDSRAASALGVALAVVCSVALAGPAMAFRPSATFHRYGEILHPSTECPANFRPFDGACWPSDFASTLEAASRHIRQNSSAGDSIFVFPYQNLFGIASQRNVAGGVLQSFLASGTYLSQLDLQGLRGVSPPLGLYMPDERPQFDASWFASLPIDGVSNFTRSPEVWLWTFQHYVADAGISPDVLALRKDDSRAASISVEAQPLRGAARSLTVHKRSTTFDLGEPGWPDDGADFLRLRMTVHYSWWWRLRKPERLQLELARSDGSRELRSFLLPPNVESEVWIYPWPESGLANFFGQDEKRWRPEARPAITHLRLWATPLDWVSVRPDAIEVHAVETVRVHLR